MVRGRRYNRRLSIDVASMADGHNVDHVGGVVDRDDDAAVTDEETPERKPALKLLDAHRSRVALKRLDPLEGELSSRGETGIGHAGPGRSGTEEAVAVNAARGGAPHGACPRSDGDAMCGARFYRAAVRRGLARRHERRGHIRRGVHGGGRAVRGIRGLCEGVWRRPGPSGRRARPLGHGTWDRWPRRFRNLVFDLNAGPVVSVAGGLQRRPPRHSPL